MGWGWKIIGLNQNKVCFTETSDKNIKNNKSNSSCVKLDKTRTKRFVYNDFLTCQL